MHRTLISAAVPAGVASCALAGLSWTEVYSTDFDSGMPAEHSGAGVIQAVPGVLVGLGHGGGQFGGNLLHNASQGNPAASTILTITNLPAHEALRLSMLMVFVDSWDSTNGSIAPDYFNVAVDGTVVLQTTSNNVSGGVSYAGDLLFSGNAGWTGYADRAFDMSTEPAFQEIAHTADSVTIEIFASGGGWQGGSDESWAIDNVRVSALVPGPSALACIGAGLFAGARRRR